MDSDKITISKINDKLEQCLDGYYVTATGFLDSHEQALALASLKSRGATKASDHSAADSSDRSAADLDSHSAAGSSSRGATCICGATYACAAFRAVFYGGYENAERRLLVFIPADWPMSDEEAVADLLCVLRVTTGGLDSRGAGAGGPGISGARAAGAGGPGISGARAAGAGRSLTHRDYLGALLGLGLDRSISGDILVRSDGADIIVTQSIADFLLQEFTKVGRHEISTQLLSVDELIIPEQQTEIIKDTVPSLRLDNIVSSAFKISRKTAVEAIAGGLVSVDHIEAGKPDAKVSEGSSLVLRGKGKAILSLIGGESKKNRIWVVITRYK